jgi:peptidoglycan/LPS O-acetylase OafA/YrhL
MLSAVIRTRAIQTEARLIRAKPLQTSESLLLDLMRMTAAALVALGHLTRGAYSVGLPNLMPLAEGSVTVFFILSGFVIRYVTCRRENTLGSYATDRASRVYSVVLPALLLTLMTDATAKFFNPGFYQSCCGTNTPVATSLGLNLVFLAESWKLHVPPLSNSPFWSLNYEVAYYAIYGCMVYLAGRKRWIWTIFLLLLAGPKIVMFFPPWLIGCAAHDLYQRWLAQGTARRNLNWAVAASLFVVAVAVAALRPDLGVHHAVESLKGVLAAKKRLAEGAGSWLNLGGVINANLEAILGTPIFLRLLFASRRFSIAKDNRFARAVRYVADGTFPLYLFHIPLLVVIGACVPYNHASHRDQLLVLTVVVVFSIVTAELCTFLKLWLRRQIEHLPGLRNEGAGIRVGNSSIM